MIKGLYKNKKVKTIRKIRLLATNSSLFVIGLIMTAGILLNPIVSADSLSQQIQQLEGQNSNINSEIAGLQGQATTYQNEINLINAQIYGLEDQIYNTKTEIANTQAQIAANEVKLTEEKQSLDNIIKLMYVDGNMTTLEMLATSNSISDFVTKEEYQNIVQVQVQNSLNTINATQATLNVQNNSLNSELSAQESINNQLATSQANQSYLLSLDQNQQTSYNAQLTANNNQLTVDEEEQAAANAAEARSVTPAEGNGSGECSIGQGTGPVGGSGIIAASYPNVWCNNPLDSMYDSNDILNRECTSFAYWYFVDIEGNAGFNPSGNAGWWWETSNFPVDTTPAVGSIGVEPSTATSTPTVPSLHDSTTGHVMIVMALPGQTYDGITAPAGYVVVASMNEDEQGHFMYDLWPEADLWYIHPQA